MSLFTSESVSHGHPDKIADQISDLILDFLLEKDKCARVAVETFVTPRKIIIAGEVRTAVKPDHKEIERSVRSLIKKNRLQGRGVQL